MTKDEAETSWYGELGGLCGNNTINEMLDRAGKPVRIYLSDEVDATNPVWAVSQEDDWWITTFETEAEAKEFVAAMEWPIIEETKET